MSVRGALALALLTSCREAPPAETPSTEAPAAAEARILHLPSSKLPFVRGTIQGRPALMIVDTGASVTSVARWMNDEIHLPIEGQATVTVAGGETIGRALAPRVPLTLLGLGPLPERPATIGDFSIAPGQKVAAILSPQQLADETASVVLDLRHDRIRREAAPVLPKSGRWRTLGELALCTNGASRLVVTQVLIDGIATPVMLDTGAEGMWLFGRSPAGQRLRAHREGKTTRGHGSGGDIPVTLFRDVPVTVGDWSTTTRVATVGADAEPPCDVVGSLSIAELQSCVLVLGASSVSGACER